MTITVRVDDIERLRAIITRRLGLLFDESKSTFLEGVLRKIAEGHEAREVLDRLETAPTRDLHALATELTVPETFFFRNKDQFRAFGDLALPARMQAATTHRRIRILSAGCASGEEAYTLAILLLERGLDPSWDVSILGIDVNPVVIERARGGRYTSWSLRDSAPDVIAQWFKQSGREYIVDPRTRALVKFEERNLNDEDATLWAEGTYDVVFCRNVLMYFAPEKAQQVVARITRALAPNGYLFLGHAETLRGLSGAFHLRHTHEAFYYQKREPGSHDDDMFAMNTPLASVSTPLVSAVEGADTWVEAIRRASERIDAVTSAQHRKTEAIALPPERPDLGAVTQLLEQERYAEALERVRSVPLDVTTDPDALLLRAVLLTQGGHLDEAEAACTRLLAIDELNAGAHYAFALCREGKGDRQGAIDHDQVASYLDRSFAMPRLHMGIMARKSGDRDTARRELEQALLLLQREEASRVVLFGGGFRRDALIVLCRAELTNSGGRA